MNSTSRWIAIGCLSVRKRKSDPVEAPSFSFNDIIKVIRKRTIDKEFSREYANKTRKMWLSDLQECDNFYKFLMNFGDKNAPNPHFVNFNDYTSRSVNKKEVEGNYYTAHILIQKESKEDRNLILFEKVSGINMSTLSEYFTWAHRDGGYAEKYKIGTTEKETSPICEIIGYQSQTIQDALRTGRLEDIELVKSDEMSELDENNYFKEIGHEVRFKVGQEVSDEEAQSIFSDVKNYISSKFLTGDDKAEMFVRLRTNAGQVKRAKVDTELTLDNTMDTAIMEQAFVRHEKVSDFEEELSDNHKKLRDDMIEKMMNLVNNI